MASAFIKRDGIVCLFFLFRFTHPAIIRGVLGAVLSSPLFYRRKTVTIGQKTSYHYESTTMSQQGMHGQWQNRWMFILAATGSAVGLGNIWKFPYITGEYGGGAFVLVYLVCIALIGIPIMLAEVLLGARGRMSPVNSMRHVAKESNAHPAWSGIGWMGVITGLCILSFYSVVAGWALDYVATSASGVFKGATAAKATSIFGALLANPSEIIFWHTVFMIMTVGVVLFGVSKGLGAVARILMPLLFVFLFALLVYAAIYGEFAQAFTFMFAFNFSALSAKGVLVALGHAFFTLSLGMGAIMAYGAYIVKDGNLGKTVVTIGFLDTLIALVAGLCIFPIVFSSGASPSSGPGLLFESLPIAFGAMPFGTLFGTLFFVLVVVAAWSSAVSLIEPGVAWLVETRKLCRTRAAIILGFIAWLAGLACALSFNDLSSFKPAWLVHKTPFDFLDFVTSQLLLPLGGLLIAIFVGWKVSHTVLQAEVGDVSKGLLKVWLFVLKFVSPVLVFIIFAAKLYQEFIMKGVN